MKFARITNHKAVDVCMNPKTHFHPTIAELFVQVPDSVEPGWIQDAKGEWSAPDEAIEQQYSETVKQVSPTEFKLLFTNTERLHLKGLRSSDETIDDFFEILEDPRLAFMDLSLNSTQEAVEHCLDQLVSAKIISETEKSDRRNQILGGELQ